VSASMAGILHEGKKGAMKESGRRDGGGKKNPRPNPLPRERGKNIHVVISKSRSMICFRSKKFWME
jgi:hypothetical protein